MRRLRQRVGIISVTIQWKRWQVERNKYFPDFYAHEEELGWLSGGFPLSMETVRGMVATRCELPEGYLSSLEKMALLPVERVFPAHHSLDIQPEIIGRMRDAF